MYKVWDHLEDSIKNCRKCPLCRTRHNVVSGEGNIHADVMIIAEAPGYDEDKIGRPFVGRAGKVLDYALDKVNLKREDIYISNIVKCHPPGNRNPLDQECDICINYLRNQVILIKPKIIILLGSVALKKIMGDDHFITKERGKFIEKKGILYMPTWHPAAVLRDKTKLNDFVNDIQLVSDKLK